MDLWRIIIKNLLIDRKVYHFTIYYLLKSSCVADSAWSCSGDRFQPKKHQGRDLWSSPRLCGWCFSCGVIYSSRWNIGFHLIDQLGYLFVQMTTFFYFLRSYLAPDLHCSVLPSSGTETKILKSVLLFFSSKNYKCHVIVIVALNEKKCFCFGWSLCNHNQVCRTPIIRDLDKVHHMLQTRS